MKRAFVLLSIVVMIIVLGSCQGNKKCPAYTKNNIEKVAEKA